MDSATIQQENTSMANSYGVVNSNAVDHKFGVYDTINGEWTGTWFESREEAESWVQTQDDKAEEAGEDWTEGQIYTVISTTDDEDAVF
jgi:hypothetical protein